jgi:hypothetical protein
LEECLEEQRLRWRIRRQRAQQARVQAAFRSPVVCEPLNLSPPRLKVAPPEAIRPDRAVIDKHLIDAAEYFDVIVYGVPKPEVGLPMRRKDEVFRAARRAAPG